MRHRYIKFVRLKFFTHFLLTYMVDIEEFSTECSSYVRAVTKMRVRNVLKPHPFSQRGLNQ